MLTRPTQLAAQLAVAFGSLVLMQSATFAQGSLERVEITGSSIKRVQSEGPAPVETYTRKDIERTGATSVNELLRSITSIDLYDQGEMASNSPVGSGTSNVKMRGLKETSVLVLLNGRRLPINALYDSSGAGAAVDLNSIPLGAIERIEILKDGASAIYGADAVAGVMNFITKKNYSGVEVRAGYGNSQKNDGTEKNAAVAFGFGNYDTDGYNILGGLDIFKRDPIFRKDRDISSSADFRRLGGPEARSSFSPYGNFIDANGIPTGATVKPCPPELYNGRCRYDFNADVLTAYNGADRASGLLVGTFKLPEGIRLNTEVLLAQSKDHFDAHPVPDVFKTATGDFYFGRFIQGGPRMSDRKSDLTQFSLGLEGSLGGLDWSVDAGQGKSRVVNNDKNYFDFAKYDAATTSGAIDPTVTTNNQALVDSLKVTPRREGNSTVTFTNAKVTGELGELDGGAIGYAIGGALWREKLSDLPDELSQSGNVVGSIQQAAVNASRNMRAIFGELALPVTKELEAQVALRYDHYPTADKTSPKVAVKYLVSPTLSLRSSYSQSFRAPSLKQMFGAREEGAADFTSAQLCTALGQAANCTLTGFQINGSNTALKPERGTTINFGVVTEPIAGLSASIDRWRVTLKDAIDTPTIDQAVAAGKFGRDSNNRLTVTTDLTNFAQALNEGIDVDLRWRSPATPLGTFSVRNGTTLFFKQRKVSDPVLGWQEFNDTYVKPSMRNVLTVGLDTGAWQSTFSARTVGGFYDTDEPDPDKATERKVPKHTEFDIGVTYSGVRNLRIDVGIKNLTNIIPPFSFQNAASNQYTQMGVAELYSTRGRFYQLGVTYQF
jgi:iron complex outermembrane receptor protein